MKLISLAIAQLLLSFALGSELDSIETVTLYPLHAQTFFCGEHPEGIAKTLGDALGADCLVVKLVNENGKAWPRFYENDGKRNEDWFGWQENILAPFDGIVEKINLRSDVNEPGVKNQGPAGYISFLRDDGMHVIFGHIASASVKEGDRIIAGQIVAKVGNNGIAVSPHTHVGAWKDGRPYQIRFDLRAMGKIGYPIKN